MTKKKEKIAVAMSGGVDSSVAALLLKKQGYQVFGVFMRLGFRSSESENASRRVALKLKIPFYPINLSSKFRKEIIDYFLKSYQEGLTPNPCIRCNKLIKFGELLKRSLQIGADFLATGHYAKKIKGRSQPAAYKLFKPKDKAKDQTYFLYNLTQGQLAHILFPLAGCTKEEVRKIAQKENLPYLKSESQDICFLAGKDHNIFLKSRIKVQPGPIKILGGKTIGVHQGLAFYTLGQRRGIEIGGSGPYYAARFDYKNNILYVVKDPGDPVFYCREFYIKDLNWLAGQKNLKLPLECEVVIRYRHPSVKCFIKKQSRQRYLIRLLKLEWALTPGQSAVFYRRRELLGGGIIDFF